MSKTAYEVIEKSQTAKFRRAEHCLNNIAESLEELRSNAFDGKVMQSLKDDAEELVQSLHEYSAYENALNAIGE